MVNRASEVLTKWLHDRGLNQDYLAEKMECTQAQISRLLSDQRNWKVYQAIQASEATGIPLGELIYGESSPSPNLLPFNRRKTDDPELAEVKEKITQIWEWVKDDHDQKEFALRLLDSHYEGFRPKGSPTKRKRRGE